MLYKLWVAANQNKLFRTETLIINLHHVLFEKAIKTVLDLETTPWQ